VSYVSSLKRSIFQPTEFFTDLGKTEPDILRALGTFLLSSVVLVGTIFLGEILFSGDLIYYEFDLQTSTYLLQQYTTFQLFGFYLGSSNYLLLFFDKIFFLVKMWLIVLGMIYLTAIVIREEKGMSLVKLCEVTAWSSTILLILGGITIIFWGIRFIFPLYYHYLYYGIFLAILTVLMPAYLITGLGKSSNISIYKRMILIFIPMTFLLIFWLVNHSDILLSHMF